MPLVRPDKSRSWRAPSLVLGLLLACNPDPDDDGGDPSCVARMPATCTPLYEPSFDRVFTETLEPRCAVSGGACHGEAGASGAGGGLVFGDMAGTHATLLQEGFIVPGDAACSALMVRLDTDDPDRLMPPGSQPLPEAERCAVAQWIEAGAEP